ncbi:NAD-dependent epimerase/dehydratase family protein [Chloroflexota bacterium]
MNFENSLILVTGGAGSIGSNLVKRLHQEGAKIIVLDDLSSGSEDNIAGIPDVQLVRESITSDDTLSEIFSQPINYVFHLAASFANQKSIENPLEDLEANIIGTLKLLQHSTQLKKLSRFIFTSSSCIYGHSGGMTTEETVPAPDTPYGISKLAGENYVRFFYNYYNFPAVILRYFNCYGPGEYPGKYRNVIPNFLKLAIEGQPLLITGTGEESRIFTYVSDVVDGTVRAASTEIAIGEYINITSANEIRIKDLAEKINAVTGNKAEAKVIERRDWDSVARRFASHGKAKKLLGYNPVVSLDEGLNYTYTWLLELKKQGKL